MEKKEYKGKLITFEGSEGSGKSTQMRMLYEYLKRHKIPVLCLREPGGVKISEQIRAILLDVRHKAMSSHCETLLYMAARAQLVDEKLIPALEKGRIILCDRFMDSTPAYQGFGSGVDIKFIKQAGIFATRGIQPDITFFFDIAAREGLARIKRAKDRIERRALTYHERVRAGYRQLAKKEPGRIKTIPVNKSKEDVHAMVRGHVDILLGL